MGKEYLIDSNVLIDYLAGRMDEKGTLLLDKVIDSFPKISVITKIEVLGYRLPEADLLLFSNFIEESEVLSFDDTVVDYTIEIRKRNKIKLPDAIIAATALANQLTLLTRNNKDFIGINNLDCINPWQL